MVYSQPRYYEISNTTSERPIVSKIARTVRRVQFGTTFKCQYASGINRCTSKTIWLFTYLLCSLQNYDVVYTVKTFVLIRYVCQPQYDQKQPLQTLFQSSQLIFPQESFLQVTGSNHRCRPYITKVLFTVRLRLRTHLCLKKMSFFIT